MIYSNSVLTIDWVKKNAYKRRISVESERLPYPIIIDEIHHELNKNKKHLVISLDVNESFGFFPSTNIYVTQFFSKRNICRSRNE